MSHIKKFKFLKGYSNNINSRVNIVSPRTSDVMSLQSSLRTPSLNLNDGLLSQIIPIELTSPNTREMLFRNHFLLSDSIITIHRL